VIFPKFHIPTEYRRYYIGYVKLRNTATTKVRNAAWNYEKNTASKAKKNPKAFYHYGNGRIKGRTAIPD